MVSALNERCNLTGCSPLPWHLTIRHHINPNNRDCASSRALVALYNALTLLVLCCGDEWMIMREGCSAGERRVVQRRYAPKVRSGCMTCK